jgi:RNA polymerase sigma factor (sigma-70 family)
VYASALRQTGDPSLAQDVTQVVFILLARKAAGIKPSVIVSGWLFRATRFAAKDLMKAEYRRLARESSAYADGAAVATPRSETDATLWDEIAPSLDGCLSKLSDSDRHALLLRFFENRSLAEVGSRLGIAEDAARKRVRRALDRLHQLLVQHGASIPNARLEPLMTRNASPPAPAHIIGAAAGASLRAHSSVPLLKLQVARLGRHLLWQQWKPWVAVAIVTGGIAAAGWETLRPSFRSPNSAAVHLQDDYRPAGFPDANRVNAFVQVLQQGTSKADKDSLAHLVRYPLRVNRSGAVVEVGSPEEFAQKFEDLFGGRVSKIILKSPSHGLYCDNRGIMIGAGELWLGPDEPGSLNPAPKIVAINLDP